METFCLLGEEQRIVGVTSYAVRSWREAARGCLRQRRRSDDSGARADLTLVFADIQADIAAAMIRGDVALRRRHFSKGLNVMADNVAALRSEIIAVVTRFMSALAARDDSALKDVFARSRSARDDVYRVMDEYGSVFAEAPRDAYETLDIIKIGGASSLYAVDADFWDEEGRRTDLTAQLTIELGGDDAIIQIDDVRVM